jgi:hypothetical protein
MLYEMSYFFSYDIRNTEFKYQYENLNVVYETRNIKYETWNIKYQLSSTKYEIRNIFLNIKQQIWNTNVNKYQI